MFKKRAWFAWVIFFAPWTLILSAFAVSVTGSDWRIYFNLPDQNAASIAPDEYAIRDAMADYISALQTGNVGTLAAYTFSGSNRNTGAAGLIVSNVEAALNRGASVRMAVDRFVDLTEKNGGSNSLAGLAARPINPLVLVQDPSAFGLMHDKLGLFDYGPTNRWVFIASWNFTGGASIFQWNTSIAIRNAQLYAAYSNELAELLAGRFHSNPAKSHAHDKSPFTIDGSWGNGVARFAPYPDGFDGGNNMQTDITNLIAQATNEIVFALNKLTRPLIATELVRAANRGLPVHGVIPNSDSQPPGDSTNIYIFLTTATNYTTTNVVHLLPAYSKSDYSAVDTGQADLVHAKFMVIDPFGDRPTLIHGSANWTDAALASDDANDENVVVIRHREIARNHAHFKYITGAFANRDDFWLAFNKPANPLDLIYWSTSSNVLFNLEQADSGAGPWTVAKSNISAKLGPTVFTTNVTGTLQFFRAARSW